MILSRSLSLRIDTGKNCEVRDWTKGRLFFIMAILTYNFLLSTSTSKNVMLVYLPQGSILGPYLFLVESEKMVLILVQSSS